MDIYQQNNIENIVNGMLNDIRVYNYHDNEPLITRMAQAKKYFDDKFAGIHADVDLTEVENKFDTINNNIANSNEEIKGVISDSKEEIKDMIGDSKEEIIETIENSKPCLCHIATKKDICEAKNAIISKIDEDKDLIIQNIDEKFVDLNELIKQEEIK